MTTRPDLSAVIDAVRIVSPSSTSPFHGEGHWRRVATNGLDLAVEVGGQDLGGGLKVTTKYLNHPILVLGYKFEFQGKVLCTSYDHEMFRNVFDVRPDDPGYDAAAVKEGEIAAREENEKVQQFYKNADILVHDTQYTHKEYLAGKIGWGHSSFEWAINSAHKAGVKHLVLFHHEPLRNDQELEGLHKAYLTSIRGRTRMKVSLAQEGKTIEV